MRGYSVADHDKAVQVTPNDALKDTFLGSHGALKVGLFEVRTLLP